MSREVGVLVPWWTPRSSDGCISASAAPGLMTEAPLHGCFTFIIGLPAKTLESGTDVSEARSGPGGGEGGGMTRQ